MAAAAPGARSERDKMLAGELYYSFGEELLAGRQRAKELLHRYNHDLADKLEGRTELLQQLLGGLDPADPPFIEPPFRCDYGSNIYFGSGSYLNFNCTILDACRVAIGSRVLCGPNVQLYSATHPLEAHVRQGMRGPEFGRPITVEDDVWVGGGAIICPGVTVGEGAVVGAGAVVTRDVPPYAVVAGNPARVIRQLKKGATAPARRDAAAAVQAP